VPDKTKDTEAVRFYYDREKVVQAIRGLYPANKWFIIIGLIILAFIVVLIIGGFQPYVGGGWEIWAITLFFIFIATVAIYGMLEFEMGEKHTGDDIIKGLGPEDKLFLEANQEGLSIPAGLIDLEQVEGNMDLLKRVLPIPYSEIRWAGIGIGPGMFKNLVVITDKEVPLFETKNLAIETSALKQPVESIADVLMSRGVIVKVVWCMDFPFGYHFDGFQPMGPNKDEVIAVNDHEKGRTYEQRDREKIIPVEKVPVPA